MQRAACATLPRPRVPRPAMPSAGVARRGWKGRVPRALHPARPAPPSLPPSLCARCVGHAQRAAAPNSLEASLGPAGAEGSPGGAGEPAGGGKVPGQRAAVRLPQGHRTGTAAVKRADVQACCPACWPCWPWPLTAVCHLPAACCWGPTPASNALGLDVQAAQPWMVAVNCMAITRGLPTCVTSKLRLQVVARTADGQCDGAENEANPTGNQQLLARGARLGFVVVALTLVSPDS